MTADDPTATTGPTPAPSPTARAPRMSGEQRREQILAAALPVFAEGGYAGTTTDQVARAAGVSQPYVIRLFGSKQQLFLDLYRGVATRIIGVMSAVEPGPGAADRTGRAYVSLMADRDLLRVLMHGFTAASDPQIGTTARHTLGEVFALFRERVELPEGVDDAALTEAERSAALDEVARRFVADGMLINVLLAADAFAHVREDRGLDALLACVGVEAGAAAGAEIASRAGTPA
ncbi:TetR/AcrR family transcriptional regulator [Cellulomonas endometrii]|uniref:TetR/AcrR family transcriptional regulator n=1 Tax=Cellulomonas endometrii TaxID=3036301 RepID=UPI0024ACA963|nr:helix-turn-helix domain-containing protein [Cellulomonas endometrii]